MTRQAAAIGVLVLAMALFCAVGYGLAAPGDTVFERAGEQGAGAEAFVPAFFPHWVHRIRYRCYVCHPALFEMKQGVNAVTMDSINKGEHCGACHNGRAAFIVEFQTCNRCHVEPEE